MGAVDKSVYDEVSDVTSDEEDPPQLQEHPTAHTSTPASTAVSTTAASVVSTAASAASTASATVGTVVGTVVHREGKVVGSDQCIVTLTTATDDAIGVQVFLPLDHRTCSMMLSATQVKRYDGNYTKLVAALAVQVPQKGDVMINHP